MIISDLYKFVYIHIQKTGGTSVEESLVQYLGKDDIIFGGNTTGWKNQIDMCEKYGYKYHEKTDWWIHSGANTIKKYLGEKWNEYYKFATVRDPVEIMTSYYYYIEGQCLQYAKQQFEELILDIKRDDGVEFEINNNIAVTDDVRFFCYIKSYLDKTYIDGFISKVLEFNGTDVHPQWTKIDESVDLYDLTILKESWPKIIKNAGLPSNIPLLHINQSKRGNLILKNETIDLIKYHFKQDYENIPDITKISWS